MSDRELWAMIADALERGRRGEPTPCDGCGTPTPPDQLREAAVPTMNVDFGDYDVTLKAVGQYCPDCATRDRDTGPPTHGEVA
ncbi:MAG: hypothetical protein ACRDQA_18610 [Nocardioidaceae bacterium]